MYLDKNGLLALWREALLAKKVLQEKTKGYKNHPQLERFKQQPNPVNAINEFLFFVCEEACVRCYCFDKRKIGRFFKNKKISVTSGQISFEFKHLKKKLSKRDSKKFKELLKVKKPLSNPLFRIKKGSVEDWEIT